MAVDVLLEASCIDQRTGKVFHTYRKIVSGHLKRVATISKKMATSSGNVENTEFSLNIHSQNDASNEKFILCFAAR